jgi:hypothetical protein
MERRLENNFVYQCSKKLLDDVDKKISGDDAGKICSAAEKSEIDQKARNEIGAPASTPATTVAATPAPTATPAKASPAETDEVKPEPTPQN